MSSSISIADLMTPVSKWGLQRLNPDSIASEMSGDHSRFFVAILLKCFCFLNQYEFICINNLFQYTHLIYIFIKFIEIKKKKDLAFILSTRIFQKKKKEIWRKFIKKISYMQITKWNKRRQFKEDNNNFTLFPFYEYNN